MVAVRLSSLAFTVISAFLLPAQTTTSVALQATPLVATYGHSLTLTATVTPSVATGRVTFYDGTSILGVSPVSGGSAALSTILLASGHHTLHAYFNGLPVYQTSVSSAVPVMKSPLVSDGFSSPIAWNAFLPFTGPPYSTVVADFNNDGKADLATTGGVALGNGDGTFSAIVATGSTYAAAIATGDFNGDGRADLVTTSGILVGNGDGTFLSPIAFPSGSGTVVAVADFNGDGKADLATTTGILTGNGDGTFQPVLAYPAVGLSPYGSVAVGDFNGDGKADVFVISSVISANPVLHYQGMVFVGKGDGTFQATSTEISYNAALGSGNALNLPVTTGDFNGDGKTDLALAAGGIGLNVFEGNGDGTFLAGKTYALPAAHVPGALAVADFNGDGRLDLAVVDAGNGSLGVFAGIGDGTFGSPVFWAVGTQPQTIAVGDFNNDGRADVVVSLITTGNGLVYSNSYAVLPGKALSSQTISFPPINNVALGVAPFVLLATASSGLAVSYTSSASGVCTLAGSTVTVLATGACSITATQAGNSTYEAATPVTQSFTVVPGGQTITFGQPGDLTFGGGPIALSATASSGLPVSFSVAGNSVCSVFGVVLTVVTAGTCSVTASQAGNANYAPATPVTRSLKVLQAPQSITFGAISAANVGAPFTLSAAASSGLVVGFASSSTSVCGLNGTTLIPLAAGNCTIIATQSGDTNHLAASPVTQSFAVNDASAGGGGSGRPSPPAIYSISATPANTAFTAPINGGASSSAVSVLVAGNISGLRIPFTASASHSWIVFTTTSVTGSVMSVSVNTAALAPGTHSGTITLTSAEITNSPVFIPVTVNIGPAVQSLVSSATFQSGGLAPGSTATIFGKYLTSAAMSATALPLPTSLGGVSATIAGVAAPLFYVSPAQVNLEVPYGIPVGPAQLQLSTQGTTQSYPILIVPTSPAIFTVSAYAAAIDSDGSVNGSGAGFGAAIAGDYVSVYITGGGAASADETLQSATQAFIGGQAATVLYAGLNPFLMGVDQINILVPSGLASGDYPLTIYVAGNKSNSPLLKVTHP